MRTLSIALVLLLVALVTTGRAAAGVSAGQVVPSGDYTLAAGEVLDGDLVVFSGNVRLEEGARVDGDVVLFSGNARIEEGARVDGDVFLFSGGADVAGEVTGDAFALSGTMNVLDSGDVAGEVGTLGGNLRRAPGARVGRETTGRMRTPPAIFLGQPKRSPADWLGWLLTRVVVPAVLAVLVVAAVPGPVDRVAQTAVGQAGVSGGVGLAMLVLGIPILIVMAITVCLLPVTLLGFLLLALATIFGLVALGTEVGRRLEPIVGRTFTPLGSAAIGTFVLALVLAVLGEVPCLGDLVSLAVSALALGAVTLTRFGLRDYPAPIDDLLPVDDVPTA